MLAVADADLKLTEGEGFFLWLPHVVLVSFCIFFTQDKGAQAPCTPVQ